MRIDWNSDAVIARLDQAKHQAITAGAHHLLDESNRIAPIETGDMIRSGTVVSSGGEAAVGYTSVYAARQHEEVGWLHDDGRQSKYLETALEASKDDILQTIADRVARELGG